MKLSKIFGSLLSLTLVAGAVAAPGASEQTLTVGSYRSLPQCGGTVEVTRSGQNGGQQINLVFSGVKACSNFDIIATGFNDVQYKSRKLGGTDGNRSGSFTLSKQLIESGFNDIQLVVQSNSKKTQDYLNLVFEAVKIPDHGGGSTVIVAPPASTNGGW